MKDRLRALFHTALRELDVGAAIARHVQRDGQVLTVAGERIDLAAVRRVFVLAIGKAARPMAQALLPLLHGSEVRGLLVPPRELDDGTPLPPLELCAGGHPVPDLGSLHAAERALVLLGNAGEPDLVLFLISGGGSALFERPLSQTVPLADVQALHRLLVACGADILAINVVRKHFSSVKGGRLALRAAAAQQITLLISDVPAAHPDAVASGPSLPDAGSQKELDTVLERHDLRRRLPSSLQTLLRAGHVGPLPRPGDRAFARSRWTTVLDNDTALAALRRAALAAGFAAEVVAAPDSATAAELADTLLAALRAARTRTQGQPTCVLAGGELSVPLPPQPGRGGRNQQFVLAVARRIASQPIAVLSAGTDG
ncbi:MAG TPA: DUF4147 domain-containing protein, partial [Planctomycetota bacterium]|nr:DUF4147 domain-containing protein [Planctomycetota bacterium]